VPDIKDNNEMKNYKRILFPYAYNILGSTEDAKDAVQDVLTNFIAAPKEGLENETGYLVKSLINHSINLKNRKKKVSNEEVWLPEPVSTEGADNNINLRDIASYSLLVLLEHLNPKERAVFILKEAFNYSHEEISEVLSSTVENSRKLLSRAKTKLNQVKQSGSKISENKKQTDILENYVNAIRGRDTKTLENLLSQDIVFFADGGEKLNVVKKICVGRDEVSPLLIFIYFKFQEAYSFRYSEINHQPAILYYLDNVLKLCQVFNIDEDGKILQINNVLDPDKLKEIQVTD
jgi:RNA polymerase sigma factor (sigma-70 family)